MVEFVRKDHQVRHHPDDWREDGHDSKPRFGQTLSLKGDSGSGEVFIPDDLRPMDALPLLRDGGRLLLAAISHAAGDRLHPQNP